MAQYVDDWKAGFEIQYMEFRKEQCFWCRGRCPNKGDMIGTEGPLFVVTSVTKETSTLYSGTCRQILHSQY